MTGPRVIDMRPLRRPPLAQMPGEMYLNISEEAYHQMLKDEGIAVLSEERWELTRRNELIAAEMKMNQRKITALTSTIAALHIYQGAEA